MATLRSLIAGTGAAVVLAVTLGQYGGDVKAFAADATATAYDATVGESRVATDARTLGNTMLAMSTDRPARLTCLNDRCSRIAELPDLVLAQGNKVHLVNVSTDDYKVVVTTPHGGAAATYDSATNMVMPGDTTTVTS